MEGKRLVHCFVLTVLMLMTGCTQREADTNESENVSIVFDIGNLASRSSDPEEDMISDVNLLVFNEYGIAEKCIWTTEHIGGHFDISLTTGKKYRFVAFINFGYQVNATKASDIQNIRHHLAYPDEYKHGIPMSADTGYIPVTKDCEVVLELCRLMSKISIRMDRSRLSEDIKIFVAGIRIGNCPKSVCVFGNSRSESQDDCFTIGFSKSGEECNALNMIDRNGLSHPVSLYMLENIQGTFCNSDISSDSEKVFDADDPRRNICSYIEIDLDYISQDKVSQNGFLKYRFYLGENRNNLNVERNCHYRITVCPEDDGLKGDGWRVDKSHIVSTLPPTFSYYPDGYIRGNIGDTVHIGCHFTPSDAPFDVGLEYMENDKKEGIYDFVIDKDGHGAVLTFTGPGSGLIYMSVGPPVNDAALWFIEVNQPSLTE